MSSLRGLDKETAERIAQKYDPELEQRAMDWIGAILNVNPPQVIGNDGASLYKWLKDGVILCRLLNAIQPNTVPSTKLANSPRNQLEERVRHAFS